MLIEDWTYSDSDNARESDADELGQSNEMQDNDQGITNSSPQQPQQPDHDSSPKPSTASRDSSPASSIKGKHHESSSAKKRRKKPRNIYVTPQKLRILRQKQKEREEHKKKIGLADAMTGDGIRYGSASQDSVNNAFEEDFGPLLRGELVVIEDAQISASSLDVAVNLLLDTALGDIGLTDIKKEDGEAAVADEVELDAHKEDDEARDIYHTDANFSPVIASLHNVNESSLDALTRSKEVVKGGSPSYQLLAEAETGFGGHDSVDEEETFAIDSSPEVQKIMPLMKESVLRIPLRKLAQQNEGEVPRSRRSVSTHSVTSHGSQFRAESPEVRQPRLEILDDPEAYLNRPLPRRLSFGPDDELQERIARGIVNVADQEEDIVMVNFL